MASSVTDAKIEPARPILPESSSDRVPSRETLVTTAMSALFLALGESKTLVRGLEAWQHDLDRSALKLAPLPSAVLLAASRLPRSPPSIRDAWAFFLRTVFSDKDCAKYCSLTLTPTLTFDMVVDVPALVVDVPHIVSQAVPELEAQWELTARLGEGRYGVVWAASNKTDATSTAAVKLCSDSVRELAAYERLRLFERHPNVLDLRFVFSDQHHINLGFELCKMDLINYCDAKGPLGEQEACQWVRQLAAAVAHVHVCGLAHLDIKLDNAFITYADNLKLGDFGLAIVLPSNGLSSIVCGSRYYIAPEVTLSDRHGPYQGRAADVWSIDWGLCLCHRGW